MDLVTLIILGIIFCILYLYGFFVKVILGKDLKYVINKFRVLFNKFIIFFKGRYFYK